MPAKDPFAGRTKRRISTLERLLGDLAYEREQMEVALCVLAQQPPAHERVRFLALEAFIIHARNLRDFLYWPPKVTKPRDDDVIANDFFVNPHEWTRIRPKETLLLQRLNERANKHLGHLTYTRLKWKWADASNTRSPVPYYRDILEALNIFRENADRPRNWSNYDSPDRRSFEE
jgi:hypothetical protein